MAIMGRYIKAVCFLLFLGLIPTGAFSQDEAGWGQYQTVPETLLRPEMSEAPHYPSDMVIGELGQGTSPDGAYIFAGNLLSALIAGISDAPVFSNAGAVLTESLLEKINEIEPRSYHLGGGRTEADGSVSFLIRFLGWEESIAGELYVRQEENSPPGGGETGDEDRPAARWYLDDLLIERKQTLTEIRDSYRYDFTPYERFY